MKRENRTVSRKATRKWSRISTGTSLTLKTSLPPKSSSQLPKRSSLKSWKFRTRSTWTLSNSSTSALSSWTRSSRTTSPNSRKSRYSATIVSSTARMLLPRHPLAAAKLWLTWSHSSISTSRRRSSLIETQALSCSSFAPVANYASKDRRKCWGASRGVPSLCPDYWSEESRPTTRKIDWERASIYCFQLQEDSSIT